MLREKMTGVRIRYKPSGTVAFWPCSKFSVGGSGKIHLWLRAASGEDQHVMFLNLEAWEIVSRET